VPVPSLARALDGETPVIVIVVAMMVTYLSLAVRRAYGGQMRTAAVRAAVLSFVQMALVLLYHDLLFFTTFYST
jgi:hypothetical protein